MGGRDRRHRWGLNQAEVVWLAAGPVANIGMRLGADGATGLGGSSPEVRPAAEIEAYSAAKITNNAALHLSC